MNLSICNFIRRSWYCRLTVWVAAHISWFVCSVLYKSNCCSPKASLSCHPREETRPQACEVGGQHCYVSQHKLQCPFPSHCADWDINRNRWPVVGTSCAKWFVNAILYWVKLDQSCEPRYYSSHYASEERWHWALTHHIWRKLGAVSSNNICSLFSFGPGWIHRHWENSILVVRNYVIFRTDTFL